MQLFISLLFNSVLIFEKLFVFIAVLLIFTHAKTTYDYL